MIKCVKCNEVSGIAKSGKTRGKQRYFCRHCDYYFTMQQEDASCNDTNHHLRHHATIVDIARQLKISKSTVSRALRNSSDIKKQTRDAVLLLAKELNYVPNHFASALVKKKSYSIGIVVPELITNFFPQFIIAAQNAASLAGYEVVICHSNERFSNEVDIIKRLFAYQVDGVLLSITSETKTLDHLNAFSQADIPVILFNRVRNKPGLPKVLVDDQEGAFAGVEHLIKNGYRKIAHIAGPQHLQISKNRLKGYEEALAKHNLKLNPEWVFYHDLSNEGAQKCARQLLDQKERPDAVFAVNDPAAIQLILEARKRGITVGPDLGVVGFSNDSRSDVIDPPLTTLEQPIEKMAESCIHLLVNKIGNPAFTIPASTILKTQLIQRLSSVRGEIL